MDSLNDLPPTDTVPTSQEKAILENFFDDSSSSTRVSGINWKLVGITSVLFLALANPWIDQVLCKVPYCGGSPTTSFITKLVVFIIILVLLQLFL
jgi:hypothetical protein